MTDTTRRAHAATRVEPERPKGVSSVVPFVGRLPSFIQKGIHNVAHIMYNTNNPNIKSALPNNRS